MSWLVAAPSGVVAMVDAPRATAERPPPNCKQPELVSLTLTGQTSPQPNGWTSFEVSPTSSRDASNRVTDHQSSGARCDGRPRGQRRIDASRTKTSAVAAARTDVERRVPTWARGGAIRSTSGSRSRSRAARWLDAQERRVRERTQRVGPTDRRRRSEPSRGLVLPPGIAVLFTSGSMSLPP